MKISEAGRKNQKPKGQGHKHCKSDCVEDNHFVKSLRKYSNKSTASIKNTKHNSKQKIGKQNQLKELGCIKSLTPFRPRYITKNTDQMKTEQACQKNMQGRQIEQLIIKVSLEQKKNGKYSIRGLQTNDKGQAIKNSCNQTAQDQKLGYENTEQKPDGFEQLKFNVERISKIVDKFSLKFNEFHSGFNQKDSKQIVNGHEIFPTQEKSFQQFSTKTPPQNITKDYMPDVHIQQFSPDSKQKVEIHLKKISSKMSENERVEKRKAIKKFVIEGNKLNYIMFNCLERSRISQLSLIESRKNI